MREVSVDLNNIANAKKFVALCKRQAFEINVISGPYRVNGKSIMELFSLDLSTPVTVEIPESALDFANLLQSNDWCK